MDHGPSNDRSLSPSDPHAELCRFNPRGRGTDDDNLFILDLENIVLTVETTERQRDAQTREVKCLVAGITLEGATAEAVVKIGFTGKLIVITVYLC